MEELSKMKLILFIICMVVVGIFPTVEANTGGSLVYIQLTYSI